MNLMTRCRGTASPRLQVGTGSVFQTYNMQTARRDSKNKDTPAERSVSVRDER